MNMHFLTHVARPFGLSVALSVLSVAVAAAQTAAPALTTIYSLSGSSDGADPESAVAADANGVLYGTSLLGGSWSKGTVFSLTPPAAPGDPWTPTLLHTFQGRGDGANPVAPLTVGPDGVLYGTTIGSNGVSFGNIYRLIPPATPGGAWTENVLWNCTIANGIQPLGALLLTKKGVLLGTMQYGGAYNSGVVFALTPPASGSGGWNYTILHSFNGLDGSAPDARLIAGKAGSLYSTSYRGGANNAGTIYRLSPPATPGGAWTETVLHSFTGGADGGNPIAGLTAAPDGTLYGVAQYGGATNQGTVFSLSPSGTFSVLYSFTGGTDGAQPYGDLLLNARGALIGTASAGGVAGAGNVFVLTPPATAGGTWKLSVAYAFSGAADGASPHAGLIRSGNALYGTTSAGGVSGLGSVFQLQ